MEVNTRMPNAKVLSEKQAIVAELTEKLQSAAAGVLVDYKGITVAEDTALRAELRKNNVDYAVVKNTLLRFACQQLRHERAGRPAQRHHVPGLSATMTPWLPPASSTTSPRSSTTASRSRAASWTASPSSPQRGHPLSGVHPRSARPAAPRSWAPCWPPSPAWPVVLKQIAEKGGEPVAAAAEEAAPAEEAAAAAPAAE